MSTLDQYLTTPPTQVRLPSMDGRVALVPWADMLNHSCEVCSQISLFLRHLSFKICAGRNIFDFELSQNNLYVMQVETFLDYDKSSQGVVFTTDQQYQPGEQVKNIQISQIIIFSCHFRKRDSFPLSQVYYILPRLVLITSLCRYNILQSIYSDTVGQNVNSFGKLVASINAGFYIIWQEI